jgi:hypothetical protein
MEHKCPFCNLPLTKYLPYHALHYELCCRESCLLYGKYKLYFSPVNNITAYHLYIIENESIYIINYNAGFISLFKNGSDDSIISIEDFQPLDFNLPLKPQLKNLLHKLLNYKVFV